MARAIHGGCRRHGAGQVRLLHILREGGTWPGRQTLCRPYPVNSTPVVIDPMPAQPPDGLAWCPKCVGHLAERLGVLKKVAAELAAESRPEVTR